MPLPGALGPRYYTQPSQPTDAGIGDFWFDGSVEKILQSQGWLATAGPVADTVSAGMGATIEKHVVTNAQVMSGTTTAQVSGLSANFVSGAVYEVDALIAFNISAVDAIKLNLSGPVSGMVAGAWFVGKDLSSQVVENIQAYGVNTSIVLSTTSIFTAEWHGIHRTSGTPGHLNIMLLCSAAAKDVNIKQGSFIRAYRVA